jgi:hypothetical protein
MTGPGFDLATLIGGMPVRVKERCTTQAFFDAAVTL